MFQRPMRYVLSAQVLDPQMPYPLSQLHVTFDDDGKSIGTVRLVAGNAHRELGYQPRMVERQVAVGAQVALGRRQPK